MPAEKRKLAARETQTKAKKRFHYDPAGTLTPGARGCFVTCARGKEAPATSDLMAMFERHLERHPDLITAGEGDETVANGIAAGDVEDEIANELKQLQAEGKPGAAAAAVKPLAPLKTLVDCVLFVKMRRDIDPRVLVHSLFEDKLSVPREVSAGRFVHRLTPISASSDASLDGLKRALELGLPPIFGTGRKLRYRIDCDVRYNEVLKRQDIIPVTADSIQALGDHEVNLTEYDLSVNITVMRGFLGVGFLFDHGRFRKYNIAEVHNGLFPTPQRPSKADVVQDVDATPALEEPSTAATDTLAGSVPELEKDESMAST